MDKRTRGLVEEYEETFITGPPIAMFPSESDLVDAIEEALETGEPIDPMRNAPEEVRRGSADV